jgi:NAD(P)-dependent dehydrogenase (short-subunit alcohol dehydrogenase family)
MLRRSVILLVSLATVLALPPVFAGEAGSVKAVLVTGASTGIGRKITERLAADGYLVYAGARKAEDLKALGAIKNVVPLRLDVTQQADIDAAVATVRKGGHGLYGLVNNAGVATGGNIADVKPEEFDLVMQVNVYGPYRMTRAFLPLITEQKGRITNIGSISGVLANSNLTAYSMSKHAIEAFTDSMAMQLAASGVTVNIVEPGDYNSSISRNAVQRLGGDVKTASGSSFSLSADRSMFKDPDEVAEAVEQALFEPNPKRRYLVVPDAEEGEITLRKQIQQLVELNEGQPYTLDRAALIRMLDEALARSRPRSR